MSSLELPGRRCGMAVLVAFPGIATKSAQAEPQLTVEAEADAYIAVNPFLVSNDDQVTLAGQVALRPKVSWPIGTGRTTADFEGEVAFRQYHRRYGNFVTGRALASVNHRHNEYWTLRASASYVREVPTEASSETVDAVFDAGSVSETAALRASGVWNLNAATALSTDVSWEHTRFRGSDILAATRTYQGRIGLSRRFSRLTSAGLQLGFTASRAGDEDHSTTAVAQVTASRALSSSWRLEAAAGVERASMIGPDGGREHPIRFRGSAEVCYERCHLVACLSGAVRSAVSGLGGLQREQSFGASLRRQISDHASLSVAADYSRATVDQLARSADLLRVSGEYRHRIARDLSVTGGITYLRRNALTDQRVSGATFRIGIVYQGFTR